VGGVDGFGREYDTLLPKTLRVLTSQELLAFFREFQGEQHIAEARLYSVEEEGDTVLASGSAGPST
jgi:hypothetical protein